MTLFLSSKQQAPETAFWNWFRENEAVLFNFEVDQKRIFHRLLSAMRRVHPDLVFEFGPKAADGTRDFVISAGGMKAAFPKVESLFAAAPLLPRWRFTKYRQRRNPINDLTFNGRTLKAADVRYKLFRDKDPKKIGITLFLEGYNKKEEYLYNQFGYLFLDQTLGEYDIERKVGVIVIKAPHLSDLIDTRPLTELPAQFDAHFRR